MASTAAGPVAIWGSGCAFPSVNGRVSRGEAAREWTETRGEMGRNRGSI